MKLEKHEGRQTRRVLAAMARDQAVLARIAAKWPATGGLFDAPWANVVGGWCVAHLRKHGVPPNGQLEVIFGDWAARRKDGDKTVAAVEGFLRACSDEAAAEDGPPQTEYLLELAEKEFRRAQLRELNDALAAELAENNLDAADERLGRHVRVELAADAVFRPASDVEIWREAYSEERLRPVVVYPGGLGRFYGNALARGALIAWQASDKTGKSYHLLDLTFRAVRQRCRVVFFDAGDNDKYEVARRLACRTLLAPTEAGDEKIPLKVGPGGKIKTETRRFEAISPKEAFRRFRKLCRGRECLRVSCHPNRTLSVEDVDGTLADWERRDGWRPDVVVVDYADILAPPRGVKETLDQIDETWMALRRLSQARHCLVATATQASAAAYDLKEGRMQGKKHFGGRKTKLAHVNGMVGIQVTPAEKERGICRLNWIVRRGARYSEIAPCWAAGNLALACPTMASYF